MGNIAQSPSTNQACKVIVMTKGDVFGTNNIYKQVFLYLLPGYVKILPKVN